MPEDPNKSDRPEEADEEVVTLDDGDATCIDTDGNEISIDEALAEPTDPDIYPPRAVQEHISAFESLKSQLSVIFAVSNDKKTPELPAKNPLTCFLDGMEIPVKKAVRIAQSREILTSAEAKTLSDLIDVNLCNANISVAQAIEIAERPGILTLSETAIFKTFKEVNPNGTNVPIRQAVKAIQKRKTLTDAELKLLQPPLIKIADIWIDESLRSAAKYTTSGSHPEAIARMDRRMADPFALTANVCLLENGHKKKERVSLAELIIIYEDAGLISAEDAVAQTEALTNKLTKLGLTPKDFQRKFESSKKNRIKDENVQRRISIINETIDSPNEISHHVLNGTTRMYEEVSIGDMIADLFEELDLLPEDEKAFRTPLEIKYDSKLERLGLTREEVNASIPTRLNHLDGEKPRSLSVFGVLRSEIAEAKKDPQSTFTTYVETAYGLEEVPILVAIALAVETQGLPDDLAKSLSRECENAIGTASQRSGSKITKSVISCHKTHAGLVWRRIKDRKNPPKKYFLPKAPSAADLLEAQVAASEGEMGNASFHPLKKILEARAANKITHEQAKAFIIRTVGACRRKAADSMIEAYSFVGLILRLRDIREALELLDLMPISEEDKRDAREILSDETPSAASISVNPEKDSDEFSVYNWERGQGLTSSLIELDGDGKNTQRELRRTAILASFRETARSPLAIISATATAVVMLLMQVAIELNEKAKAEKETAKTAQTALAQDVVRLGKSIITVNPERLAAIMASNANPLTSPDAVADQQAIAAAQAPDTSSSTPDQPTLAAAPRTDTSPTTTDQPTPTTVASAPQESENVTMTLPPIGPDAQDLPPEKPEQPQTIAQAQPSTPLEQLSQPSITPQPTPPPIIAQPAAPKQPIQSVQTVQPSQPPAEEPALSHSEKTPKPTETPAPQLDAKTLEALRSTATEALQTTKTTTSKLAAWVQAKIDIAKAELESLTKQIAEFRRSESLRPQTSPRPAEPTETATILRLHEKRAIETTLSALPQEPQQVAQAPVPVQPAQTQPVPQPSVSPAPQPPPKPQTSQVQPSPTPSPAPQLLPPETPETIEVQIPIATAKTNLGFIVDSTKSYALWRARGWQGSFTRTDADAVFTIIIPDKKTGKSYRASIPTRYASAQKTVPSTAMLIK